MSRIQLKGKINEPATSKRSVAVDRRESQTLVSSSVYCGVSEERNG